MAERRADIIVIGAGASGMAAAYCAKRACPELSVLMLERADRVGRKILVTGNGRCNLSNLSAGAENYNREASHYEEVFRRYGDDISFFRSLGLPVRSDAEGRLYPCSNQAASVLDALRYAVTDAGAELVCSKEVTGISRADGGFTVTAADGSAYSCHKVIVAAGSAAGVHGFANSRLIASLRNSGEDIADFSPALVSLIAPELPAQLKGSRVQARVSLEVQGDVRATEQGEVQFGEGYVSGICVMDLSRHLGDGETAVIAMDICPDLTEEELEGVIGAAVSARPESPLSSLLSGVLPKALGETVLKNCCRDLFKRKTASIGPDEMAKAVSQIKDLRVRITGKGDFRSAQICTGGVRGLSGDALESPNAEGLYFCGEIVDVDGRCGGYNLHWAWASGRAAGTAAAKALPIKL